MPTDSNTGATTAPTTAVPPDQPKPATATPVLDTSGAQDHTSGATALPDPALAERQAKARADVEAAERKQAGDKATSRKFPVSLYPGDPNNPKPDFRGCINGRWFAIQRGVPVELTEAQYCVVLGAGEPVTVFDGYRHLVPMLTVKPLNVGGRLSDQAAAQDAGLTV